MSVGLGDLQDKDYPDMEAMVWASNYDADRLAIDQDGNSIVLTRRQLQQLSIIVDRFMDD